MHANVYLGTCFTTWSQPSKQSPTLELAEDVLFYFFAPHGVFVNSLVSTGINVDIFSW